LPAAIFKIISSTGTRRTHIHVHCAFAPSLTLQPVAEMILKTE